MGAGPVFEGALETPTGRLSVCSVVGEVLLEMPVASENTWVEMWVNDSSEPDAITIVVKKTPTESSLG